jgi:hypothetical protein
MAVRHARLLHFGYLITGSDPGFPRTALSAGTWRTRRACQCAPCLGSPQSAHALAVVVATSAT